MFVFARRSRVSWARESLLRSYMCEHARSAKRRRISTAAAAVTSKMPVDTTIRLTHLEERLRELFLDVATYVDKHPAETHTEASEEPVILRFTGGWVRDKLLGSDSNDIDIGINRLTGMQFGLALQQYLQLPGKLEHYGLNPDSATVESGDEAKASRKPTAKKPAKKIGSFHKIEANPEKSKHLETATIKILGTDVDVVNLRKESYTETSRNPQMMFGTPLEDALRRDATVNAMFYNLHTASVEDFTEKGLEDLENGIIRTPLEPYQTFKDDPLRVLRLIRFASRLNFTLEDDVRQAMKDESIKQALRLKISRERVGIEVEKMLRGPHPRQSMQLIDDAGLFRCIFEGPSNENPFQPDFKHWSQILDFYQQLLDGSVLELTKGLILNADDKFMGWLLAAMTPWRDAPPEPQGKSAYIRAFASKMLVEGLKLGNRYNDVVSTAYTSMPEIKSLAADESLLQPEELETLAKHESAERGVFGMKIRNWGKNWRSSFLLALIVEAGTTSTLGPSKERQAVTDRYLALYQKIESFGLLDVADQRQIINGGELLLALGGGGKEKGGLKNGKWMRVAMDSIMEWQLGYPNSATKEGAVKLVRSMEKELEVQFAPEK